MKHLRFVIAAVVIVAAVVSTYWSVRGHDFVKLDDETYITKNVWVQQGMTWEGVKWAFSTFLVSNWHPLTWLSHMIDCELFELTPTGHHMMNMGWHAINAVLLLAGLRLMTGMFWPSAMAALLWALHPLRVESVAWAAERKDVLTAFFGLSCIVLYALYARKPNSIMRYLGMFATLALGLMCKPMLVTWPCLLLLLDFWPLRRWRVETPSFAEETIPAASLRRLLVEKIPLLGLCVGSSIVTMFAQRDAFTTLGNLPVGTRVANAAMACVNYLGDTFWPVDLAILYPHPMDLPMWPVAGAIAVIVCTSIIAAALWRPAPWLLIGWLWFLGTLVPVLGLVQVGVQARADRYTYLPQIGLVIAVVWTLWRLVERRDGVLIVLTVPLAFGLWLQTRHQVGFWRDTETVYRRAVAVTSDNWMMEYGLGSVAIDRGDLTTAERQFRKAYEIAPNQPLAQVAVADMLLQRGALVDATQLYEAALVVSPANHGALNNLAWILATAPQPVLRNPARAVTLGERACAIVEPEHSDYAGYLDTLSAAYASIGRFSDAIATALRGREVAVARGQKAVTDAIDQHLQRYRQQLPAQ